MTTLYLDIAAVRIQTWLGRSTTLQGRRGASAALSRATGWEEVHTWLDPHISSRAVGENTQAGDVDGVVNLELTDGSVLDEVMATCLRELRRRLPALEFQAVHGRGPDYLTAYLEEIGPRVAAGQVHRSLPVLDDFPPLVPCDLCRVDSASGTFRDPDGNTLKICPDCTVRRDQRGHTRVETDARVRSTPLGEERPETDDDVAEPPPAGAEARLLDALQVSPVPRFAHTFDELAAAAVSTTCRSSDDITHLATVFIDGNKIGDLFKAIAGGGEIDKATLAGWINDASGNAAAAAVRAICDPATVGILPVSPHVQGGDDLVVSVPARAAWPFTCAYLKTFAEEMAVVISEVGLTSTAGAELAPTASAGIVIAHKSYPFSQALTLAEELLVHAKEKVRGQRSSLAWVDITTDGPARVAGRPVLLAEDIDGGSLAGPLQGLARLTGSQRSTLAGVLRNAAAERVRRENEPGEVAEPLDLDRHLDRLGLRDTVGAFLAPDGPLPLADALILTRWLG